MESPIIELTRVLYHLDYFRRNFRKIGWHRCNSMPSSNAPTTATSSSCTVCSFKSLFTDLSLLMRESVLDPPHIHHVIESNIEDINWKGVGKMGKISGSGVAHAVIYESVIRQIEEGSSDASPASGLQLHTEFNVTKICLHCRTTNYVESISQYTMQIDSSTLLSNDWPSFEFAIKTSLDSEEFCVQPNCHGQTKVFRLLNSLPAILPICFIDPSPGSLITLLPTRLRPHLIFETSKSIADLHLKAVILYSPQWGYATLFHHSRLDVWIFIDSRRILSLYRTWIESRFHPITYGFLVYYCFYCKEEQQISPLPEINSANPPSLPTKFSAPRQTTTGSSRPVVDCNPMFKSDQRIYENWPLDTDSGQGSEFSSNCSSSASASIVRSPSTASAATTVYATPRDPSRPHLIFHESTALPQVEGMIVSETASNRYATVRRRIKYQRKGSKYVPPSSLSLSVPDLSTLSSLPAPAPPSAIRRPSPHDFETNSRRQSVDSGNRKVSFNCEVTLVDDLNDDYIPHPIFSRIMGMLNEKAAAAGSG
ncbi:uncharacterized protein LOC110842764 [Folsomia candida]|uniref:Inactive ubiquitin carboxyl-terminal hydrolase 53 n=1 Tax=Folsomia candida TaxID=158441 RepID=A0A226F063_FOLCA|nr:uncharacterized protein LOC110842764 [Folsomia candida]OXA63202.1 Inactive ubiquitin carboxyl-terminal hydrolase 53 [Folsomia candida]